MSAELKGFPAAPGLARGPSLCWDQHPLKIPRFTTSDSKAEIKRLEGVRQQAGEFLTGLVGSNRGRGTLLIAFGFFTLLFGLIRMIAGSAYIKDERQTLVDVRFRLLRMRGLVNFLVGVLLIAVGVLLIVMRG